MTKPARTPRKRPKLAEVKPLGTASDVIELLDRDITAAGNDEILAYGRVLIRQGGEIEVEAAGDERGFRHVLIAGTKYLMDHLSED